MSKHDLTIFRYSTILTLTRNGISTMAELERMTNEDIGSPPPPIQSAIASIASLIPPKYFSICAIGTTSISNSNSCIF